MKKFLIALFILFSMPCFADRTIPYYGGEYLIDLEEWPDGLYKTVEPGRACHVSDKDRRLEFPVKKDKFPFALEKDLPGITAGKKIDCVYSGRYSGGSTPEGAGSYQSSSSGGSGNKTVHVNAYARNDGTQVREYFRAAAGSKN